MPQVAQQQKVNPGTTKIEGHLLVKCVDQSGIVSKLSTFLYTHGANIVESSQYSNDPEGGMFFIRLAYHIDHQEAVMSKMEQDFKELVENYQMSYQFYYPTIKKRAAIFVSKDLNCLMELLWEWKNGDLLMDIPLIISNNEAARNIAEIHNIPFYYIPANKEIRAQVEQQQIELLEKYDIDFIVLARYMQILTPQFVAHFEHRIINIHHSFLPAFIGADPYSRAHKRGVKLIGATSHYVTNDLDEGPIIEQDVERVDHRDDVASLKKIGGKIERRVLARAVRWHLENRIIVEGNKTIVFH